MGETHVNRATLQERTTIRGRALVYLVFTGSMLGSSTILARLAFDAGIGAIPFLMWSLLTAAAGLMILGARRGPPLARLWGRSGYLFVAGLLTIAAPNLLVFSAAPVVGAGFVALAITFPPLLTYVGAVLLRLEAFDARRATGVVLAMAGAVWLALAKIGDGQASPGWVAATLMIPVFLAAGNIFRTLKWPVGARPDELAPGMLMAAAVILLGFGLSTGQDIGLPSETAQIILLVVQSVVFGLQFVVFFMLQREGGPVMVSMIGAVAALVTVPLSMILLAEQSPQGLILGGGLIATGIFLVTWTKKDRNGTHP